MTCRKNVNSLSTQEKLDFIQAVKALKANGKYNQYVRDHQAAADRATPSSIDSAVRNSAHRGPAFLPWHREFLRRFEADLQAEVPGVVLPYWDWATDAALADPATAPVWANDMMGGDGDSGDNDIVKTGPFAFDKNDVGNSWTIADGNGNDTGQGLQRAFGEFNGGIDLPTQAHVNEIQAMTPYDVAPWNRNSNSGYRAGNEGWLQVGGQAPSNTHNRVHLWVGGSMLPPTSPNDPVFFLHHCFIDKLWADWQAAHPGEPYVPGDGESADLDGHRLSDAMYPWSTTIADTLDHRAMGYVYDTDAPEIALETPSLVFNDVPEGSTTVRAAVFTLSACENLTFDIISGPTVTAGPPGTVFGTPLGTSVTVDPHLKEKGRVWISYTGTVAGDLAQGTVTIQCNQTGEQFVIPISANTIAKPTVATVLVLDQSGSMDYDAGDGRKRIDVLKEAAPIFVDLLDDDDAVGVVRFDHDPHPGTPVEVAGPMVFGAGRVAAKAAISGHAANPAGSTSIGDGIDLAHTELSAPAVVGNFDETAMVVLTDGRENATQYISDVTGIIGDRVFGIGLGTAEQINPAALTALTDETGGYVLMTGILDTDDFFILQKYFLQILAGVTNVDVVLDPEGWVAPGVTAKIPFLLNEADITTDVILLTADAPPYAFQFAIETPSGAIISPSVAATTPGTEFAAGKNVMTYRITLPSPVAGFEEREGTWHALLRLDDKGFRKYLGSLDNRSGEIERATAHGLRYNLVVHSGSDLRMIARMLQSSMEPGAILTVRANITQFGLPIEGAQVRGELTRPDGTASVLTLAHVEPGVYQAQTTALMTGIYNVRVLAEGRSLRSRPFTREQLLSASIWRNGDTPPPSSGDGDGGGTDGDDGRRCCKVLICLLEDDMIKEFVQRHGLDADRLIERIRRCCEQTRATGVNDIPRTNPDIADLVKKLRNDLGVIGERLGS